MPGHEALLWVYAGAPHASSATVGSPNSFLELHCAYCNRHVSAAVLVRTRSDIRDSADPEVIWVRCTNCGHGSVLSSLGQVPGARPGADLAGLPDNIRRAYDEARSTASVGAWTATEMVCRKILMHVAVDKGADAGKTFASYLTYLQDMGYVSPVMAGWVDLIRKHGNEAVHDLPEVTAERGRSTLIFTEQLLRTTYEMDALARQYAPGQEAPEATTP